MNVTLNIFIWTVYLGLELFPVSIGSRMRSRGKKDFLGKCVEARGLGSSDGVGRIFCQGKKWFISLPSLIHVHPVSLLLFMFQGLYWNWK